MGLKSRVIIYHLEYIYIKVCRQIELFDQIPDEVVKVSESGINDPNAIVELRRIGYQGFLIGEYFMASADPPRTCREFIRRVNHIEDLLQNAIA